MVADTMASMLQCLGHQVLVKRRLMSFRGIKDRPRDNRLREPHMTGSELADQIRGIRPASHPRDWLCRASEPRGIRAATALQTVFPRGFDLAHERRVESAKREATVLKKGLDRSGTPQAMVCASALYQPHRGA